MLKELKLSRKDDFCLDWSINLQIGNMNQRKFYHFQYNSIQLVAFRQEYQLQNQFNRPNFQKLCSKKPT